MRLLLIAITLAVCCLSIFMTRGRIYPVTVFTLLFGFLIAGALFLFEDEQWGYFGILWLLAALFFVNLGSLVGRGHGNERKPAQLQNLDRIRFRPPVARVILVVLIVCGILWLGIELRSNQLTMSVFASPDSLLEVGTEIAERRYSGGSNGSTMVQLLASLTYSAALCGGSFYLMFDTRKDRMLCVGTMLPISLLMILTNAKAGFIASIMLWLIGYITGYIRKYGEGIRISDKRVLLFLCITVAVLVLLYITFLLRVGSLESWAFKAANEKFGIYAFAGIYNFDYWVSNYGLSLLDAQFGINTFMSAFSLLGFVQRAQGVYQTMLVGYGNIFTSFRGLTQDFTCIGALLLLFLLGCLEGFFVKRVRSNVSMVAQAGLAAIGFFYTYSLIISPWVYTTYVIPFVILLLSLRLCGLSRSENVIS